VIAWRVQCIATRADILGFAAAADLLYIMMYDTRSQIFDQCIAGPNAGLPIVQLGVQQCEHRHLSRARARARAARVFSGGVGCRTDLDLGVPAEQLILGVPWCGHPTLHP
jgi:di-N-acetylchitobiase